MPPRTRSAARLTRTTPAPSLPTPAPSLLSLPQELLLNILCALLDPEDLAHVESVGKVFTSAVEAVLRLRAAPSALSSLGSEEEAWMNEHARITTILFRHERSCKALLKARVGILSTGDDHTLLLQNGRAYSCGAGDQGELGYACEPPAMIPGVMYPCGFICSSRLSAIPAFTNRRVKMVAAGQMASVVLLDDGSVYTFGIPFVCGHPEGENEDEIPIPRKVAALDGVIITCVAASRHAIAVSASGSVYSWGEGDHGGLGHGIFLPRSGPGRVQHEPRRVLSLRGIRICVACVGNDFTLLLSEDGVVFACGSNDCGQLGFPQPSQISDPRPIEGVPRIQAMAAGGHTLLLSCEGDIFSCGCNSYGQLGLGHTDDLCVPTKVSSFVRCSSDGRRPKFAAVAADTRHSAAISAEGHVYTWGAYGDGRLGHGTKQDEHKPRRITPSLLAGAVYIDANSRTMVVCADGSIYGFGGGSEGQLGIPNVRRCRLPQQALAYEGEPKFDERGEEWEAAQEAEEWDEDEDEDDVDYV